MLPQGQLAGRGGLFRLQAHALAGSAEHGVGGRLGGAGRERDRAAGLGGGGARVSSGCWLPELHRVPDGRPGRTPRRRASRSSARRRSSTRARPGPPPRDAVTSGTPRRLERRGHRRDEAEALQRLALLQFRVGGDHRPPAGGEFAASGCEGFASRARPVPAPPPRAGWPWPGAAVSPRRQQPVHRAVAEEHLPLVAEVPEEGALRQPRALRDVDHRRVLVAPLREQFQGGHGEPLGCVRFPAGHANSVRHLVPSLGV